MKYEINISDYPLMKNRPEIVFTPDGTNISDITLKSFSSGKIKRSDCRTSKSSLLYQAEIARQDGNFHLAENFERAAEMAEISSDRIIEIYNALRPYRSTEEELQEIASELRNQYSAQKTAKFVEDAIVVMKKRRKLKGDR